MAFMVLDTETAPYVHYKDGKPHPETSGVYDLGYVIVNEGEVVVERSLVITDVFYNADIMKSAYYADKLPQYHDGLKSDEWQPISFLGAWRLLKNDIKEWDVREVWAYNCLFDLKALNATIKRQSNGFNPWFFPYKVKVRDIWDYASNITSTKKYLKFCAENGFFTQSGNPKTSAEIVYAFLTGKVDYAEHHTALEDARIELAILQAAKAKHKRTRHKSRGQGWRDAATAYKALYD